MAKQVTFKVESVDNIAESVNYSEYFADSVVTVGTGDQGTEMLTMIFLNFNPVVGMNDGMLTVTGMEKRKVASVTLTKAQAEKYYDSLKSIFEAE
ncbi:TPA: hypothetical protein ACHQNL_001377 [Serratia marcescens]|uniref:hypothetical protein n=1 Tax=Serratia TaxID=613 RepID=UPI001127A054|nr:hypothetical protein [Serratia marcescens]MBN5432050.1 hypothetical protein [Serratia marcescens]MDS0779144.1 hypothetical protein [Serratia marcescens]TPV62850.1 hypothetical protein FJ699_23870 [Serratia marcescens]BEO08440.1 hypothetical protein SMQC15_13520 [Serratia marcescens]